MPWPRGSTPFAVSDRYQGTGIGTNSSSGPRHLARSRVSTAFEAYLLYDNQKMRDVFADAGFGPGVGTGSTARLRMWSSLNETEALHEKTAARNRAQPAASLTPFFQPHSSPSSARAAAEAPSVQRSVTT